MAKFTDEQGLLWVLRVNRGTVVAVREACGIDLADVTGETVKRLYEDLVKRVDVLWVLCRAEAEKRNVSEEQFGESLVGEAVDNAYTALIEAISDFSPSHGRVTRAVAEKAKKTTEAAMSLALATLNDPAMDEKVMAALKATWERHIAETLTQLNSATSSPGSSG